MPAGEGREGNEVKGYSALYKGVEIQHVQVHHFYNVDARREGLLH